MNHSGSCTMLYQPCKSLELMSPTYSSEVHLRSLDRKDTRPRPSSVKYLQKKRVTQRQRTSSSLLQVLQTRRVTYGVSHVENDKNRKMKYPPLFTDQMSLSQLISILTWVVRSTYIISTYYNRALSQCAP